MGKFRPPRAAQSLSSPSRRALASSLFRLGLAASALKLLLIPSAPSTDFEVHRWWKALTYSRPLGLWYTDTSSVWTLDYPPLFAYFERLLAAAAAALQPALLQPRLRAADYGATLLFMRLSVISTDVLLTYAVYRIVACAADLHRAIRKPGVAGGDAETVDDDDALMSACLLLFSPGLFLVDNVHFQYNGLVIAVLLLALSVFMEGSLILGSIIFTTAINLKHTLLPAALPIGVYILSHLYTRSRHRHWRASVRDAAAIALSIASVTAASWLPLYRAGGPPAVRACLSRMFPFGRGLLHAYWAPNFWALYASADRVGAALGCRLREADVAVSSGHIGAQRPFVCLPNVTPGMTASLVLAAVCPVLVYLARACVASAEKNGRRSDDCVARSALLLPRAVSFCLLSAFVFGWHVHEKMILLALAPLACVVFADGQQKAVPLSRLSFSLLAFAGQFALHPLITAPGESMYKLFHFSAYALFSTAFLFPSKLPVLTGLRQVSEFKDQLLVYLFLLGSVLVEIYAGAFQLHTILFGSQTLQFLPLMIVSAFSGTGVLIGYCLLYRSIALQCRADELKEE